MLTDLAGHRQALGKWRDRPCNYPVVCSAAPTARGTIPPLIMLKSLIPAISLTLTVTVTAGAIAPTASADTAADLTAEEVATACAPEIQTLIDEVETGRSAHVTYWDVYPLADIYTGYPSDAPFGLWLRLDGAAADSVLASPQFMTRLSTELIDDCAPLSLVVFNRDQTGWTEEFAQVDGEVKALECVGDDYNWVDPVPWGQRICGL